MTITELYLAWCEKNKKDPHKTSSLIAYAVALGIKTTRKAF